VEGVRVVTVRRSTQFPTLNLPLRRFSQVSFVQKSAGNSDLEKLMIEFLYLAKRVSTTEFWWDRRRINRITSLFPMNLQETHSEVHQRKGTLEFSKADLDILHAQLIDGR